MFPRFLDLVLAVVCTQSIYYCAVCWHQLIWESCLTWSSNPHNKERSSESSNITCQPACAYGDGTKNRGSYFEVIWTKNHFKTNNLLLDNLWSVWNTSWDMTKVLNIVYKFLTWSFKSIWALLHVTVTKKSCLQSVRLLEYSDILYY